MKPTLIDRLYRYLHGDWSDDYCRRRQRYYSQQATEEFKKDARSKVGKKVYWNGERFARQFNGSSLLLETVNAKNGQRGKGVWVNPSEVIVI